MKAFSSKIHPKAQARLDSILAILAEKALTKKELAEALQINSRSTQHYVTYLRKQQMIYVSHWKRTDHKATQYFKAGNKKDALQPKALTSGERAKRYRKRMDDEKREFRLAARRARRWADKWSKVAPPETFWIRA